MSRLSTPFLWLAVLATLSLGVEAPAEAGDVVRLHQWKHRVLLVLAPDASDARLTSQRNIFRAMGAEASDRDLELVEVIGETTTTAALRQRFGLGPGFHAVLVGKDGGAKLDAEAPLRPEALLPLIDAMPMRQEEMRRRS